MEVKISGVELTNKEKKIIKRKLKANKEAAKHIKTINFNIKEYSKSGFRHKVIINSEAKTDFGTIHSDSKSWRFALAVRSTCKKLFKQVLRSKGKKNKNKKRKSKKIINKLRNFRK